MFDFACRRSGWHPDLPVLRGGAISRFAWCVRMIPAEVVGLHNCSLSPPRQHRQILLLTQMVVYAYARSLHRLVHGRILALHLHQPAFGSYAGRMDMILQRDLRSSSGSASCAAPTCCSRSRSRQHACSSASDRLTSRPGHAALRLGYFTPTVMRLHLPGRFGGSHFFLLVSAPAISPSPGPRRDAAGQPASCHDGHDSRAPTIRRLHGVKA